MLALQNAQKAAKASVSLDAVKNVSEEPVVSTVSSQENQSGQEQSSINIGTVQTSSSGEFSEQPYEPLRDGVTEIVSNSEMGK